MDDLKDKLAANEIIDLTSRTVKGLIGMNYLKQVEITKERNSNELIIQD